MVLTIYGFHPGRSMQQGRMLPLPTPGKKQKLGWGREGEGEGNPRTSNGSLLVLAL